jgi:hypothetical protein
MTGGPGRAARADRRPFGRCHSLKREGPALGLLWAIVAALGTTPALAAHCPHGQLYRVHLDQCVDLHSRLALAYVAWRALAPVRRPDLPPRSAAPPAERPLVLPPLEPPSGQQIYPPLVWPDPD